MSKSIPPIRPLIVEYGLITAYGDSVEELYRGLNSGETAVSVNNRFSTDNISSKYSALTDESMFEDGDSQIDRMLRAVSKKQNLLPSDDRFLILSSTVGEIELLEKSIETGRSIEKYSNHNLLNKAVKLFSAKDGMTISSACSSSTSAIIHASELISKKIYSEVVVVGCDSVSEFVSSGFSALQALDAHPAKPFDKGRAGLSSGEGIGYIVLKSSDSINIDKFKGLTSILSGAFTNDSNHMTGPSRDGEGLSRAIDLAVKQAGISASDIGFICAHGTGTSYNDLMEIKAFKSFFDYPLPVFSIKGGIGHTMAAAGILEVILSSYCLHEARVPGTVGLENPIPEAVGWVSPDVQPVNSDIALTVNSGFGGVNAAILLKKYSI